MSWTLSDDRATLLLKTDNSKLQQLYSSRITTDDSGVDLYCPETIIVPPKSQAKIVFQVRCQMEKRGAYTGYILAPRSSIVKTPLRMSNSIGIIDASYTGILMAFVDNISDGEYVIEEMTRLFQIVAPDFSPVQVKVVDNLKITSRGEGGFGSTGK
jgi:dUTP pyrophosphatase